MQVRPRPSRRASRLPGRRRRTRPGLWSGRPAGRPGCGRTSAGPSRSGWAASRGPARGTGPVGVWPAGAVAVARPGPVPGAVPAAWSWAVPAASPRAVPAARSTPGSQPAPDRRSPRADAGAPRDARSLLRGLARVRWGRRPWRGECVSGPTHAISANRQAYRYEWCGPSPRPERSRAVPAVLPGPGSACVRCMQRHGSLCHVLRRREARDRARNALAVLHVFARRKYWSRCGLGLLPRQGSAAIRGVRA